MHKNEEKIKFMKLNPKLTLIFENNVGDKIHWVELITDETSERIMLL